MPSVGSLLAGCCVTTFLLLTTACATTASTPSATPAAPSGQRQAEGPPKVQRAVVAVEPTTMESNVLRQLGATTAWPMFPMYE